MKNPIGYNKPRLGKINVSDVKSYPNSSTSQSHSTQNGKLSQEVKDYRKKNNLCLFDGGNHATYQCQTLLRNLQKRVNHLQLHLLHLRLSLNNGNYLEINGKIGGVKAKILIDGAAQVNACTSSIMNAIPEKNRRPINKNICSFDGNVADLQN